MALLEIDRLAVTLGSGPEAAALIEEATLAIGAGETFALVGESGSGKSLTALAIMGLLSLRMRASGSIRFDGRELIGMGEDELCALRGKRIAMIFQEPMTALNPVRSIGAQIGEAIDLHLSLPGAAKEARIAQLLERVGLPQPRFSPGLYPHQLSGGQRQRVMIAMALACDPDLLIADEPTTALDVTIQAQILDLIAGLVRESEMALLLITHDLGVVTEMAERVAVMYAGRIVESGCTDEVFAAIRHPYTAGLLAASPYAALAGVAAHAAAHWRPSPLVGEGREGGDRGALKDEERGAAAGAGSPSPRFARPGMTEGDRPRPRPRLAAIPGVVPDALHRPAGCPFAPRCPRVEEDCRIARPPLLPMERPGHVAACLHPLGGGAE